MQGSLGLDSVTRQVIQDRDLVNLEDPETCFHCAKSWVNFLWAKQVNGQGFQASIPTPLS